MKVDNRRTFFKSLAMLGAAAAGCPGIFVPKFEPIRWKITKPDALNWRDFGGKWTFIMGDGVLVPFAKAVMPVNEENIAAVFHCRTP